MLRFLAPYLAYAYMTFVGLTARVRVRGEAHRAALRSKNRRFIYAFWHNRQVFFTYTHRGDGLSVLVSHSRDGVLIAKVMELSRIEASRGSSTRGASAAIRDMMAVIGRGSDLGITPDGPKGPLYEVKHGVVFLAQKLGIPILPTANALSRKWVFARSWDRYQVPLPFSRAVVRYGAPIEVGPDDDLAAKARELKAALDRVTTEADAEAENPAPGPLARLALLALNLAAPLVAAGVALRFALSPRRGALRRLPDEMRERLGRPTARSLKALSGRPVLWVHAASAGEVGAVKGLLERVAGQPRAPAILLTCSSGAGRDKAAALSAVDAAVMAPIDAVVAVRSFIAKTRPYALVLVETELWPSLIETAWRAGLKICLVNGRVSEKSFRRYRWVSPLLKPFLSRVCRFAVQTEEDARRFQSLGALKTAVTGNMKFDQLAEPKKTDEVEKRLQSLGWAGAPIFVAGSTHPGEEEAVVKAFLGARAAFPALRLVLAPRHGERAAQAQGLLKKSGLRSAVWSRPDADAAAEALLLDAHGILTSFYARAAVCFVGGTLAAIGGHNLLEPAMAGSPALFGPHTFHTPDTAALLLGSGCGRQVRDASGLEAELRALLSDPSHAAELGRRSRALARGLQGATERSFAFIEDVIAPPCAPLP